VHQTDAHKCIVFQPPLWPQDDGQDASFYKADHISRTNLAVCSFVGPHNPILCDKMTLDKPIHQSGCFVESLWWSVECGESVERLTQLVHLIYINKLLSGENSVTGGIL